MCGRFFLDSEPGDLADHYHSTAPPIFSARYNIAPTTPLLVFDASGFDFARWGLIPSWSRDPSVGNRMFNARAETIAEKPSFRNAYRRRRCLIPANGFYEWRVQEGGKQPYCCHLDRRLFSIAGIREQYQDAQGNEIKTCALITTESKGEMRQIHHRMPVYIGPGDYADWLDSSDENSARCDQMLDDTQPGYQFYPITTAVNNFRNEGRELLSPMNAD